MKSLGLFLFIFLLLCNTAKTKEITTPYSKKDFVTTINGKATELFTLTNKNGMLVAITNYGAKIVSIYAPDKNGNFVDVVLGFNSIADYIRNDATQGAVVGPYANRIAGASFEIDGVVYHLPRNNGQSCLHSGPNSFYRQVWDGKKEGNSIILTLDSPDGEFGFPGNKKVQVTYTLTDDNELKIDYQLTTDKACYINLTNHSYFNLKGEGNGDVLGHSLVINAEKVTQADRSLIPTGKLEDIKGTDLDFSTPHLIGERINSDNPQIRSGSGYDLNYVLNKENGKLGFAASVYEPESGRYMEVFTTEPGIQLYTANYLGGVTGNSGKQYVRHGALCLETQHFPDSPHQPSFPSTLVKPGDVFKSETVFKFSVKK